MIWSDTQSRRSFGFSEIIPCYLTVFLFFSRSATDIKLALRAGNEKEEGETADTVGCCSLRVEHITLHEELDGSEFVVEFDFLGKDSIRYYNKVPVIKKVMGQSDCAWCVVRRLEIKHNHRMN